MRVFYSLKERERVRNWVKSLKSGDEVTNVIKYGFQQHGTNNPPIEILTVKKVTPTGRIRMEDGSLWSELGSPVSKGVLGELRPVRPTDKKFIQSFDVPKEKTS